MYAPGIYYNMFITSLTVQYCIKDLSTTPDDLNEKATITIVHAPLHSEEGVAHKGQFMDHCIEVICHASNNAGKERKLLLGFIPQMDQFHIRVFCVSKNGLKSAVIDNNLKSETICTRTADQKFNIL